jgi:hypothetical protein
MNYDHLNKVYDFWRNDIFPHLSHNFTVISFDDYLRRFSYLPSGKWLKNMEKVKLNRVGFAVDSQKFVKRFKQCCITYNPPIKVEDGLQRIIYQISATLHVELIIWTWIEHDVLQNYGSLFACYGNEDEYLQFIDDVYLKMHQEGNTEENPNRPGFINMPKFPPPEEILPKETRQKKVDIKLDK